MQYLITVLCLSWLSLVKASLSTESVIASKAPDHAVRPLTGNDQDVFYNTRKHPRQSALSIRDVDESAATLHARGNRRPSRAQHGNNPQGQNEGAVPSGDQQEQPGQAPQLLRSGTVAPWRQGATLLGRLGRMRPGPANDGAIRPGNTPGLAAIRTPHDQPRNRREHATDSPLSAHGSRPLSPDRGPPRRGKSSREPALEPSPVSASTSRVSSPPGSPRSTFEALPHDEKLKKELTWLGKGKWVDGKLPFEGQPFGMTGKSIVQAARATRQQQLQQQTRPGSSAYLQTLTKQPEDGDSQAQIREQFLDWVKNTQGPQ